MTFQEEIGSQSYLYLTGITEPRDNSLRLVVEAAHASGPPELIDPSMPGLGESRAIVADDSTAAWEILFESYVGYAVLNESFASPAQEDEAWSGANLFRRYTKSRFFDYLRAASFASDEYPGPLVHFEILCLNHIVEIVTSEEPKISRLRRPSAAAP